MTSDTAEADLDHGGYNLSNHAYKRLGEMIRTRRLRGGEVIIEAKLAEILGVSRTPLREALQRLEGEGLVVKAANRSFMVRLVDLAEYLHSMKVREVLEGEAAALAAGQIDPVAIANVRTEVATVCEKTTLNTQEHWTSDDNVHNLFVDTCGNPVMGKTIRELRVTTRLYAITRLSERIKFNAAEHMDILDALESGDAKRMRKSVQAHLRSLHRFAIENVA